MTVIPATAPTVPADHGETPDLDPIRMQRDSTGAVRVYADGVLLGTLTKVKVDGARNTRVPRWQPRPAASAWTLYLIGASRPPAELTGPLPPDGHLTRESAIRALVIHLRAAAAPAVAPLYRPEHA